MNAKNNNIERLNTVLKNDKKSSEELEKILIIELYHLLNNYIDINRSEVEVNFDETTNGLYLNARVKCNGFKPIKILPNN